MFEFENRSDFQIKLPGVSVTRESISKANFSAKINKSKKIAVNIATENGRSCLILRNKDKNLVKVSHFVIGTYLPYYQ